MDFLTIALDSVHEKEKFQCGKPLLDGYLHKQAKQDIKRKLSACFVLAEGKIVKGYYTLSTAALGRALLPAELVKKLPASYTNLPMTLLGRLAVNIAHQRQGVGELLLVDALKRCYLASLQVESMAVVVDPIDEAAVKFYQRYDFIQLADSGKMFLPIATIAQLFRE
ncbi:MAG: GNAT family N-acetyltransferase [Chitinophagaceae bacterium]|nr:MAG: GNAT family N-acetyltransferase [Chitinophagaceae bacterium]